MSNEMQIGIIFGVSQTNLRNGERKWFNGLIGSASLPLLVVPPQARNLRRKKEDCTFLEVDIRACAMIENREGRSTSRGEGEGVSPVRVALGGDEDWDLALGPPAQISLTCK